MAGTVYWVGQDGNIYVKGLAGTTGVQNFGSAKDYTVNSQGLAVANTAGNAQAQSLADGPGTLIASQITDPALASTAPAGGTASKPLDQASVDATQASINQIAPLLAAALGSEGNNYTNAENTLNASQDAQQKTYNDSTTTNQQNYDQNFMASILAGIKGLSSLKALLRGSGAAGGTAEQQVNDVVGGATANDIQTGADTQKGNQATLDSALSSFLTDLKAKKAAADDTHANNVAAINAQSATNLQDLYQKMAGYYGDAGQTGTANDFMGKATALTPQIASNSKTQTSLYDTTPVAVQAPQLTAFAAPSQPNAIAAPANGQVGSGIFAIGRPSDKKDDQSATPAAAPMTQGA